MGCIQMWLKEKSYVFTAEEVASITAQTLNSSIDISESGRGRGSLHAAREPT